MEVHFPLAWLSQEVKLQYSRFQYPNLLFASKFGTMARCRTSFMKISRDLFNAAIVESLPSIGHRRDGGNQALPVLPVACLIREQHFCLFTLERRAQKKVC